MPVSNLLNGAVPTQDFQYETDQILYKTRYAYPGMHCKTWHLRPTLLLALLLLLLLARLGLLLLLLLLLLLHCARLHRLWRLYRLRFCISGWRWPKAFQALHKWSKESIHLLWLFWPFNTEDQLVPCTPEGVATRQASVSERHAAVLALITNSPSQFVRHHEDICQGEVSGAGTIY